MSQSIRGRTMPMEKECGSWAMAWLHTHTYMVRERGREQDTAHRTMAGREDGRERGTRAKVPEI